MPFRSNIVVDSRDAGTREDNNRALVRHERDWAAWSRSEGARSLWPPQESRGREKLPKSSGGNKHAGDDGAKMRRRREKDGISLKKEEFFLFLDTDLVSTGLKINKLIATLVQHAEGVVLEERVDHDIALSSAKRRGWPEEAERSWYYHFRFHVSLVYNILENQHDVSEIHSNRKRISVGNWKQLC
jgi:hypothetical protein